MWQYILSHSPLLYFTQSLWRDEVFSVIVAQKPLSFIFSKLVFEPPVYYLLLRYWMKIFGTGEIAARSLSLVGFMLSVTVVILWSEQIFKKHWLSWFAPVFYFLNPMLLYYAFEVRTYAWYVFFSIVSCWAFVEKRWGWYVAASVLAFYTHVYFAIFLLAQSVYWLLNSPVRGYVVRYGWIKKIIPFLWKDRMFRSLTLTGFLILPWIIKIILYVGKLASSWYYPVNFQLVLSILGNMFVGYEGTPWYGWAYTRILSLVLAGAIVYAISIKQKKKKEHALFWAIFTLLPLSVIMGISFAKPLFVNRYLIPSSIGLVFLSVFAIERISNAFLQRSCAVCAVVFVLFVNIWYPDKHMKLPIRETLQQVNTLQTSQDIVLANSPLIFFETIYYSTRPDRVYLYNPDNVAFPWYVGDVIVDPGHITNQIPTYPNRAFIIQEDGSFELIYNAPHNKSANTKNL